MGEAAIANGDWLTAVKALKRARGLSPQDDTLDERINIVEEHLDELGLLKKPAPVIKYWTEASVGGGQGGDTNRDEPFAVQSAGDTGVWDDANDVFAAGMVDVDDSPETGEEVAGGDEPLPETIVDAADDSGAYAEPPPLTEDDVASIVDGDETFETAELETVADEEEDLPAEAAQMAEGSFAEPEDEPVTEFEIVSEPEPEPDTASFVEPEYDEEDELEDDDEDEQEPAAESEPTPEVEPEPLPESWPDPETDVQPELEKDADGIPLPTMTLARLAIDQNDLDLAERTLRGVLEREPGHSEAAELLETLIAGPPDVDSTVEPMDPSATKVAALQRWLDAVRLASERLRT
jgi:hypothetical protein